MELPMSSFLDPWSTPNYLDYLCSVLATGKQSRRRRWRSRRPWACTKNTPVFALSRTTQPRASCMDWTMTATSSSPKDRGKTTRCWRHCSWPAMMTLSWFLVLQHKGPLKCSSSGCVINKQSNTQIGTRTTHHHHQQQKCPAEGESIIILRQ